MISPGSRQRSHTSISPRPMAWPHRSASPAGSLMTLTTTNSSPTPSGHWLPTKQPPVPPGLLVLVGHPYFERNNNFHSFVRKSIRQRSHTSISPRTMASTTVLRCVRNPISRQMKSLRDTNTSTLRGPSTLPLAQPNPPGLGSRNRSSNLTPLCTRANPSANKSQFQPTERYLG